MIRISQLKLKPVKNENTDNQKERLYAAAAKALRTDTGSIKELIIVKRSIDARKKDEIFLSFTVDVSHNKEKEILKKNHNKNITLAKSIVYSPVLINEPVKAEKPPVIIGAGPGGLFAAYILALNGFKPLLIERGEDVDSRQRAVDEFWTKGILNKASNVQFGEGGAGTFSDGKLNTQVKDPSGRIKFVLDTFVRFGADETILYDQKPHVGTDVLKTVVKNLRNEIIALGGSVRFNSCLTDIIIKDNKVSGIEINSSEYIDTDNIILAIGHSSRDTFRMLSGKGIQLTAKDFAVGFRVMHPQQRINISQYGEDFADYFGAAPYKLTAKSEDGRGVYSFCMCPGGYVVNASSEADRTCVNGMSYSLRDSSNANSAIIVAVSKNDYAAELKKEGVSFSQDDPLLGMYFQELLEERTYRAGKGMIPVQSLLAYESNVLDDKEFAFEPQIKGAYIKANLRGILPDLIEKGFIFGMKEMGKKLKGFDSPDTILAAAESRTSSPVRINRDEAGCSSVKGLYPCGEGAGYAGGITSAAVDGIRCAENYIKNLNNR